MMMDLLDRLATKFEVDEDGCWMWNGAIQTNGYGTLSIDCRTVLAHRAVYALLVGEIPRGLEIDHVCRKRLCVNPDHLEPVTHRENLRRGDVFGAPQRSKTACPKGHPYDYVHVRADGSEMRGCRTCRRDARRRYRARGGKG